MKIYAVIFIPNEGYEEPRLELIDMEHKDTPPAIVSSMKAALKTREKSAEVDFDAMNYFDSHIKFPCHVPIKGQLMLFW